MFTRVVPVWLTLIIILGPLKVRLTLMKVNPLDLNVCPPIWLTIVSSDLQLPVAPTMNRKGKFLFALGSEGRPKLKTRSFGTCDSRSRIRGRTLTRAWSCLP